MSNAYQDFLKLRWPPDGEPLCTRCGSSKVYTLATRGTFKCAYCKKHFSATSGTVFSGRKLPFEKLLKLLERNDLNALKISQELNMQYRAAWVLCGKIRELRSQAIPVGHQMASRLKGYHNHLKPASRCDRCQRQNAPLTRGTFNLDRKVIGSFCEDCTNALSQLQDEFMENYRSLRAIKEFEENLHDHN